MAHGTLLGRQQVGRLPAACPGPARSRMAASIGTSGRWGHSAAPTRGEEHAACRCRCRSTIGAIGRIAAPDGCSLSPSTSSSSWGAVLTGHAWAQPGRGVLRRGASATAAAALPSSSSGGSSGGAGGPLRSLFPAGATQARVVLPAIVLQVGAGELLSGSTGGRVVEQLGGALRAGATAVALREDAAGLGASGLYEAAVRLKELVASRAALLVVDRVDIAQAVEADGVLLTDAGVRTWGWVGGGRGGVCVSGVWHRWSRPQSITLGVRETASAGRASCTRPAQHAHLGGTPAALRTHWSRVVGCAHVLNVCVRRGVRGLCSRHQKHVRWPARLWRARERSSARGGSGRASGLRARFLTHTRTTHLVGSGRAHAALRCAEFGACIRVASSKQCAQALRSGVAPGTCARLGSRVARLGCGEALWSGGARPATSHCLHNTPPAALLAHCWSPFRPQPHHHALSLACACGRSSHCRAQPTTPHTDLLHHNNAPLLAAAQACRPWWRDACWRRGAAA